jgi:HTH-type transcriptional regulator / antitoxin HipB
MQIVRKARLKRSRVRVSYNQDSMNYQLRRPDDLGSAIAEFRTIRGLTQAELADRVGLHRTYLSNLEGGDVPIYVNRLFLLLESLGLTITIADQ